MTSPRTPPQNLRHERRRLGRANVKNGDFIYFTHKNGKAGVGEIIQKYSSTTHPFGPSQHWKVFNMNSQRPVMVPEDRINSVINHINTAGVYNFRY